MTDCVSIKDAVKRTGYTPRYLRSLCESGKWPAVKRCGRWLIKRTAHARLYGEGKGTYTDADLLGELAVTKRDEVIRRVGIIEQFESYATAVCATGGSRTEAFHRYAHEYAVAERTLRRWIKNYSLRGAAGLVDGRGGGRFVSEVISPAAWELFKSMYLTQQRRSVRSCWQNLCYLNKEEQKGWVIPSKMRMYKLVDRQIPLPVRILHREGLAAYQAKCAPYVEVDPDSIEPGQV
ncbi:MAG: DNA-binding domain-containing protein, partial [Planctomycetota bacterium]